MDAIERRKRASEEAAEWWVRLHASGLDRADREKYVDWLRESAVHVAEMLRMAELHGALEQFEYWTRISTDHGPEKDTIAVLRYALPTTEAAPAVVPAPWRLGRRWISLVAAMMATVAVGIGHYLIATASQTIQTERGERREVSLADGSVLQVDPDTRLRIRFDSGFRRVALEKGRALFHVAKNPKRPFLVDIDGTVVRAVGTAFGVELQEQSIIVTVSEGTVEVTSPTATGKPAREVTSSKAEATDNPATPALLDSLRSLSTLPQNPPAAPIVLNSGQQITVHASGPADPVRTVDSSRELAWAQGRLIFDNVTVAEVAQLFNRYNRRQLRITDEKLGRRSMSGVFNASEPESFIAFIESTASVRVIRHDGQDVTIASSSP